MNAKGRRKLRRYLERKWPYSSPWNFIYDHGDEFCTAFDTWSLNNKLRQEMVWEKIKIGKPAAACEYRIRFRHEQVQLMFLLTWTGHNQQDKGLQ